MRQTRDPGVTQKSRDTKSGARRPRSLSARGWREPPVVLDSVSSVRSGASSSAQARLGWVYRTAVEALESMSMVLTGPAWQPLMRLELLASLVSPALIEAAFEAVG
jgi:hypothetical protein